MTTLTFKQTQKLEAQNAAAAVQEAGDWAHALADELKPRVLGRVTISVESSVFFHKNSSDTYLGYVAALSFETDV